MSRLIGIAQRVTIYISESDQWHGKPLFLSILEYLRREGVAGATVLRGVAGYGAHSRIHTATIERLSEDLPLRIEIVEQAAVLDRVMPTLLEMIAEGLITCEETTVLNYRHRYMPRLPVDKSVSSIMAKDVATVSLQTPLRDIVDLLIRRGVKAVPVVDDKRLVLGVITGGDLLISGGLALRLSLQATLPPTEEAAQRAALANNPLTAAEIMSRPVVTIGQAASVAEAAAMMVQQQLKRLPVVDSERRLVGIVSRLDVLESIASIPVPAREEPAIPPAIASGQEVQSIMVTDVPTAAPDADLETILNALLASPMRRVVVIDRGAQGDGHCNQCCPDVYTISAKSSLIAVVQLMTNKKVKRLPVVDEDNRLVGMVDRQSVLAALLTQI
ncbi:MAG: CBS domain-containing protein [Chloroflexi bacterium]|nr:CBS domain-containing protein [Chloroflexota bacterium]